MYPDNEFITLDGIAKEDGIPGIPVPELTMPDVNTVTSHLKHREYIMQKTTLTKGMQQKNSLLPSP